jgi:uracil-DNA glycosylase family 4
LETCTKCSLSQTRKNIVVGDGSEQAKVMFIGEAPGYYEDVEGRPFVGAAGKFLNELLSEAGLERSEVYIANILKCRPPNNREPLPDEIKKCTPYLEEQIKSIKPKVIVTLGNYATGFIFSRAGLQFYGITKHHGRAHEVSLLGLKVKVYPTFHPASALYHGEYRTLLVEDFKKLKGVADSDFASSEELVSRSSSKQQQLNFEIHRP